MVLAVCNEDGIQAGIEDPSSQTQAGLRPGLAGDIPE